MKLRILDKTGDTQIDMETDFDLAEQLFTEAIKHGKMAYIQDGGKNRQVFELNPEYETVIIPNFAGG